VPAGPIELARTALVARNNWIDGHADVSGWFRDGSLLGLLAGGLTALSATLAPTGVVALEAKGFVLGALVAERLGLGLVLVRKGAKQSSRYLQRRTRPDWLGRELGLRLDPGEVADGDRLVLVDDWVETGAQAEAAQALVEAAGGTWTGTAAVVDDCADRSVAAQLGLCALIRSEELGP